MKNILNKFKEKINLKNHSEKIKKWTAIILTAWIISCWGWESTDSNNNQNIINQPNSSQLYVEDERIAWADINILDSNWNHLTYLWQTDNEWKIKINENEINNIIQNYNLNPNEYIIIESNLWILINSGENFNWKMRLPIKISDLTNLVKKQKEIYITPTSEWVYQIWKNTWKNITTILQNVEMQDLNQDWQINEKDLAQNNFDPQSDQLDQKFEILRNPLKQWNEQEVKKRSLEIINQPPQINWLPNSINVTLGEDWINLSFQITDDSYNNWWITVSAILNFNNNQTDISSYLQDNWDWNYTLNIAIDELSNLVNNQIWNWIITITTNDGYEQNEESINIEVVEPEPILDSIEVTAESHVLRIDYLWKDASWNDVYKVWNDSSLSLSTIIIKFIWNKWEEIQKETGWFDDPNTIVESTKYPGNKVIIDWDLWV